MKINIEKIVIMSRLGLRLNPGMKGLFIKQMENIIDWELTNQLFYNKKIKGD